MWMLEKALIGSRRYWAWVVFLVCVIVVAGLCYLRQFDLGLGITGLSRSVSWGLYIGQFTFFVGVAASAVVVVLPYYLHGVKQFGKIVILGEFLAISAVIMCMLFIMVDLGQPARVFNIILHPAPWSLMFWDMLSLSGYLLINATITLVSLRAERSELPHPAWLRPLAILSIPWAVSIHTVTAFLYCGLPGRAHWLTAILAPRFLASAFAAGPALLILLCLALRKFASFDVTGEALRKLAVIMTYATAISVFFVLVECFTVFYSRIPEHMESMQYLYFGLEGQRLMMPYMWLSAFLSVAALLMLLIPSLRQREWILPLACVFIFGSLWLEKGICLIVCGFTPSPLGDVTEYAPTLPEWMIAAGIWSVGALLITVFAKIALAVRRDVAEEQMVATEGLRP
jgi:molybdopterin-containing oxidoreductase family membrane subunit